MFYTIGRFICEYVRATDLERTQKRVTVPPASTHSIYILTFFLIFVVFDFILWAFLIDMMRNPFPMIRYIAGIIPNNIKRNQLWTAYNLKQLVKVMQKCEANLFKIKCKQSRHVCFKRWFTKKHVFYFKKTILFSIFFLISQRVFEYSFGSIKSTWLKR